MPSIEELLQQSVASLKTSLLDNGEALPKSLPKGLIEALANDRRQGARALAAKLRARQSENRAEGQRLRHLLKFEIELWEQGFERIAGVDEAGVGPLAGPVIAGAAILPRDYKLRELNDSKKLDEATRDALAERIKADAVAWAIGIAEVEEIDRLNIYRAGLLAMRRAVEGLSKAPDFVLPDFLLVDARKIPDLTIPQQGIVRGDAQSASIAAASILAKTSRDAMMLELDRKFPGYGLAGHKGYPTPEHFAALRRLGASPIHRRSFRPVREVLGLDPTQKSLFD